MASIRRASDAVRGASVRAGIRRIDWIVFMLVLVAGTIFFACRIEHSIVHHVANGSVFGADAQENLVALQQHRYWGLNVIKHPLAVFYAVIVVAPLQVAGVPTDLAAAIAFGLCAGLALAFCFLLLRCWNVATSGALAVTALIASSFTFIVIASVIETYSLAATAIFLALVVDALARGRGAGGSVAIIAAGAAGWANPPAAAYLTIGALRTAWTHRAPVRACAAIIVATIAVIAPITAFTVLLRSDVAGQAIQYYASVGHFIDPTILADYAATVVGFQFVAPSEVFRCRYLAPELATLLAHPVRAAALIGWWGTILLGVTCGIARAEFRATTIAAMLSGIVLFLFYLYFEPQAFLLFAMQSMPAIVLLTVPLLTILPRAWIPIAVIAVASFSVNERPLMTGPIDRFDAACPAPLPLPPPVNGL